jgi:hypothetical protein
MCCYRSNVFGRTRRQACVRVGVVGHSVDRSINQKGICVRDAVPWTQAVRGGGSSIIASRAHAHLFDEAKLAPAAAASGLPWHHTRLLRFPRARSPEFCQLASACMRSTNGPWWLCVGVDRFGWQAPCGARAKNIQGSAACLFFCQALSRRRESDSDESAKDSAPPLPRQAEPRRQLDRCSVARERPGARRRGFGSMIFLLGRRLSSGVELPACLPRLELSSVHSIGLWIDSVGRDVPESQASPNRMRGASTTRPICLPCALAFVADSDSD